MHKHLKKVLSLTLSLVLCLSVVLPVFAEETNQSDIVTISSEEEFLAFAQSCKIDSFSMGKVVCLEADLDLSDFAFTGIPVFCGIFLGQNHRISGISLTGAGSALGFIRYLTETGRVADLNLEVRISPKGSAGQIGGLVGKNAGTVSRCSVCGTVSGKNSVGGIAGVNETSGVIHGCEVRGSVAGNHFVGGMTGRNLGIVRLCTNNAEINTTAQQNSVDISDITLDTVMGSESIQSVTDVGGIAGNNQGVLRSCENRANVGYPHMGYNVGGISGSQSGFLSFCQNYGTIHGRKEVGGIVGQMEPIAQISFSEDTLQILQEQMATMSALTGQVSSNIQGSAAGINGQINSLEKNVETARDALEALLPPPPEFPPEFPPELPPELPELPDPDEIHALQNVLSSSISSMMGNLDSIASTTRGAAYTLSKDMEAVMNQANVVGDTLNNAAGTVGVRVTDVSDADTEADTTGKTADCINFGPVFGDLNVGGIAGAMAVENDLDPEDDLELSGNRSMNFDSQLRAVVLRCSNRADVSVKRMNLGGIVGWVMLGLVKNCENTGYISGTAADYVGGIAGNAGGFLRDCSTKCLLSGSEYVGGVAGMGSIVSDCSALVQLEGGVEQTGAILGARKEDAGETENPLSGNFYLICGEDPGAIDGVSYAGLAQPLELEDFLALENVPDQYRQVCVYFQRENGTRQRIMVPFNGTLSPEEVPPVPEKPGYVGRWDNLTEEKLQQIRFDQTFTAAYTANSNAILSTESRNDGRRILLAQGDFPGEQVITLSAMEKPENFPERWEVLEMLEFHLPQDGRGTYLHYALPEGTNPEKTKVLVRHGDGSWQEKPASVEGSYLVFALEDGDDAVCLSPHVGSLSKYWPVIRVALLAAAGITAILLMKRLVKKKKVNLEDD